jgi:hypothetical protein
VDEGNNNVIKKLIGNQAMCVIAAKNIKKGDEIIARQNEDILCIKKFDFVSQREKSNEYEVFKFVKENQKNIDKTLL